MKKYGLFSSAGKGPMQIYDGDEMVQNKEYVAIFRPEKRQGSLLPKEVQVAAIHRAPGQSVKEISRQLLRAGPAQRPSPSGLGY